MKYQNLYTLALAGSLALLGACSSSGGGGGGSTVPPNAITFDATNAEPTLQSAAESTSALLSIGAEATEASAGMAMAILKEKIKNIRTLNNTANIDIVTGVAYSDGGACNDGGSWSVSGNETSTSDSGTITFSNCDEFGIILNGSLNYSSTWSNTYPYPYTDTASGSMSFNISGFSFSLTRINFNETGNEGTGTYSINTLTYTFDTSQGNGFALVVSPAITGVTFSCPTSGAFTLTGTNGTQARATYSGGTVTVEVNTGSGFTFVSTVSCTGWY